MSKQDKQKLTDKDNSMVDTKGKERQGKEAKGKNSQICGDEKRFNFGQ